MTVEPGLMHHRISEQDESLIDLRRLMAIARRRKWIIASSFLIVMGMTAGVYLLLPKSYTGTAVVAIARTDAELAQDSKAPPLATDSPSVDTEVQVLQSPDLVTKVVDKLNLAKETEFIGNAAPGTALARQKAIISLTNALPLLVKRNGLSYAITVTWNDADPTKAALIANTLVDTYVSSGLGAKNANRQRQVDLLSARMAQLRSQVIATDSAVAEYRAAHNLVDVNAAGGTSSAQEATALNTQLVAAQADAAAAQARLSTALSQLRAGKDGEALGAALGSTVIQQLRAQQSQLSAQRADLSGRYGDDYPDLARVNRQLADTNARIQAEVGRIVSSLESDARVAQGRVASLQGSIAHSEGELQTENGASVRLDELQRNADSSRTLYQTFLDQYRGQLARLGTDSSGANVIAHAEVPLLPSFPNRTVFGLLGLIASAVAAVAAIALLQFFERGVEDGAEVEKKIGVSCFGSIPDISTIPGSGVSRRDPSSPTAFLLAKPASIFAEAFRGLRAELQRMPGGKPKVVAITSSLPAEGKTTTAICLARSAALAGQKTILVDCDLRQRATSKNLPSVEAGLVEVLQGNIGLDKAIIKDEETGAYFLPQRIGNDQNLDLMESAAMRDLIQTLRGAFDFVVLDCAPILPVAESRYAASLADLVVVAVRWRKTPVKAIQRTLDRLQKVGAKVGGVILTRANLKEQVRSGSGDAAYYNQFKSYYL